MTDTESTQESVEVEAVQTVVDRVAAWQHGATEGTVAEELRKGFDEVGIQVDDATQEALTAAIEADDGPVDAADHL